MLKQRLLSHGFICLTAGIEGDILRLLALLRRSFEQEKNIDETNILPVIKRATNGRKLELADEITQSRYGLSYKDFLSSGRRDLPDDIFHADLLEIRARNLGATFIVAGYQDSTFPLLVEVGFDGSTHLREEFVCIGDGGSLAAAILTQREHSDIHSVDQAAYQVWEAKKYSEKIPTVGKRTMMQILLPDGTHKSLSYKAAIRLNELYGEYGPKELSWGEDSFLPEKAWGNEIEPLELDDIFSPTDPSSGGLGILSGLWKPTATELSSELSASEPAESNQAQSGSSHG
ncbi:MAG: hypothetical protein KIS96_15060 [Bauldia sp.]|nr:hypothetical protein [Bauldia sp.]